MRLDGVYGKRGSTGFPEAQLQTDLLVTDMSRKETANGTDSANSTHFSFSLNAR